MTRWPAEVRRESLLTVAVTLANRDGLAHVTHDAIARSSPNKVTPRTVRHYWPKIKSLWHDVARHPSASKFVRQDAEGMGVR